MSLGPPTGRPVAILFDWDNTLVDGWAGIAAALNAVFDSREMPRWTTAQAQASVRGSLRDTFPAMFGPGWEQAASLFYSTLRGGHLDHLAPMPGAHAMLRACAPIPIGVVSNKNGSFLRSEVEFLGWRTLFGPVIGAGDAKADKPDAAPLRMALRALGLPASRDVWFVGDTALDMQAARNAGCLPVLIGDAAHDGGVQSSGAEAHFTGCHQLSVEIAAFAPDLDTARLAGN